MWLFYVPEISGDLVVLPEEESLHCVNVLRLKPGHTVSLTDGKGFFYEAVIGQLKKKQVAVHVINRRKVETNRNYKLHIAIAPTKNISRFEWFLEKATEIGIDEITPLITNHSERKDIRADRMEKILLSAMKQSLKATLPKLNSVTSFTDFIQHKYSDYQLFIAYCGMKDITLLKEVYPSGKNALILIGPEGDFAPEEVEKAVQENYTVISLGDSRLRTETAGIVACHSFYLLNQNTSKS